MDTGNTSMDPALRKLSVMLGERMGEREKEGRKEGDIGKDREREINSRI